MKPNEFDDNTRLEEESATSEMQETKKSDETLMDEPSNEAPDAYKAEEAPAPKKGKGWKRAAVGAVTGLLIGGVASAMMGMTTAEDAPVVVDPEEPEEPGTGVGAQEVSHPEWLADDQIQVATTVSDDMSFGEAFAAARAEIGPGGCFEWHGQLYNTYVAEEWNNMSAQERAEFSDHFNWSHIDHAESDVAPYSTTIEHDDVDDIDVVVVDHGHSAESIYTSAEDADDVADQDIVILGVEHDYDDNINVGTGMTMDGHAVVLIDVDNDQEFDVRVIDHNGNSQLDEGEAVDISGQGITVDSLGGFTGPEPDIIDYNDTAAADVYDV